MHLVDFENSSFLFMRQGKVHTGERSWFHEFHLLARENGLHSHAGAARSKFRQRREALPRLLSSPRLPASGSKGRAHDPKRSLAVLARATRAAKQSLSLGQTVTLLKRQTEHISQENQIRRKHKVHEAAFASSGKRTQTPMTQKGISAPPLR